MLDLAGEAYEAVLEPTRWERVLEGLAEAFGARSGLLHLHEGLRPQQSFAARLDPHWLRVYRAYYWEHDVWFRAGIACGRASPFCGSEILSDGELLRTEFYSDFLRPQGIGRVMAANLQEGVETRVTTAFHRGSHQEDFGNEELATFAWMLGHLSRASRLSRALGEARDRALALEEGLDLLDVGVVLLDDRGHIAAMNRCVREILAARDGLAVVGAELHPERTADRRRLRALVASALVAPDNASAPPGGVLAVRRPSALRPYSVLVAPLPWGEPLGSRRARGVALVVTDPERSAEGPAEHVARLYELTLSEAKLARLLAMGRSLAEAAEELGVTRSTARTVVKRVFAKTGTRSQSDLVRLLVRSATGLASGYARLGEGRPGA